MKRILVAICLALFASFAYADNYSPPADGATNPPPAEALKAFQHFEHKPVQVVDAYKDKGSIETAVEALQANMQLRSMQRARDWNQKAASGEGRTLVIEPIVTHARFVRPAGRVFLGPLMGGSHLELKLRLIDKSNGQVIAEPVFYQRAGAGAAGWTVGIIDRAMLVRVANLADRYLRDNYDAPMQFPVANLVDDTPEQTQDAAAREERARAWMAQNPQG